MATLYETAIQLRRVAGHIELLAWEIDAITTNNKEVNETFRYTQEQRMVRLISNLTEQLPPADPYRRYSW